MTVSTTTNTAHESESIDSIVLSLGKKALSASRALATLTPQKKNEVLSTLADLIEERVENLIETNGKDLQFGRQSGFSNALLDRLTFTPERIRGMAEGVRQVAALPDPVGEEIESTVRPNGLDIRKIRVPIGVVGIIYESRPNVTIDCAVLCFKSGNACILRGGKEAFHTNTALAALIGEALQRHEVPAAAVQLIPTTDRAALNALLKLDEYVHCIIPRGGEGLIRFVVENSRIPVIKHYKGVCCLYLDKDADADMAESIAINGKVQRPGVCNSIENLFIHAEAAEALLPRIARALVEKGVELRADSASVGFLLGAEGVSYKPLTEEELYEEYLDLILSIKIVSDIDEAIGNINKYGSAHSDAIVTDNEEAARKFLQEVDSATVFWNASTRFNDGFEFGLGAEIGISTDRLHARGPMGLRELTTYKYQIFGKGQVRP